jgi:thymidylate synthase (FAD)
MQAKLISITPKAEETIVYCARVSNPSNQNNEATAPKLIEYLIKHKHWSPFEMADMTIEIETSRAIAAQILRHKSFYFQEFSQRYSLAQSIQDIELRKQAETNRQSSTETITDAKLNTEVKELMQVLYSKYIYLVSQGVAKESARMILPLATTTKMYMKGTLRSWIHYLDLRTNADTQKEHREIAEAIKTIFINQFPNISKALQWYS